MKPVELISRRTENTKTFKLRGNRFRKLVSSDQLHYKNNGRWIDITESDQPFDLDIEKNRLHIKDKSGLYEIQIESYPENVTYQVKKGHIKTFLEINNTKSIPDEVTIKIRYIGVQFNCDNITIGEWRIKKPIIYDSAGNLATPSFDIAESGNEIIIRSIIPRGWMESNDRIYPVFFDPTYTSTETNITNGDHTDHTTDSQIIIHNTYCRWRGSSDYPVSWYTRSGDTGTGTCFNCYWAYSSDFTLPSVSGSEVFQTATLYASVTNWSGSSRNMFIRWDDGGSVQELQGPVTKNDGESYNYNFSFASSFCGNTDTGVSGGPGQLGSASVAGFGKLTYTVTGETKTHDPVATCNSKTCLYTGDINNNVLTSYQPASYGFIIEGANVINHTISGSGDAGFQFYYDYSVFYPPTDWTAYGIPDDYSSYEKFEYGYATTLKPSSVSLDYGTGSIVLDFCTHVGTTVPATTWVVNYDIYNVDFKTDAARIGTVMQSRGSKVAGGTLYSMLSDWATHLTLSSTFDNFIAQDATTATATIYTFTAFTATVVDLSPYTSRREFKNVTDRGTNATGYWIKLSSNISNNHYKMEEALSFTTTFTLYGATSDVTNWYSMMVTQYGSPSGAVLDPIWPIRFNSEVVYASSLTGSGATYLTFKHSSTPTRGAYDLAYAHNTNTKCFCVPTIGLYVNSTSVFATYGAAEQYISPLEIVDGHTMDLYCWNALMNSTDIVDWGRARILGNRMATTIDVGDWVNIQTASSTTTITATNGGFETGEFTGWTNISTGTGTASIQGSTVYEGSYALRLESTNNGGLGGVSVSTYYITSDATLSFFVNVASLSGENAYFRLYAWDYISENATNCDITATTNGWAYYELDISSQGYRDTSGMYLSVHVDAPSDPGHAVAYVDNIGVATSPIIKAYRIVGLEYYQKDHTFVLEFGGAEEYYLANDQKYKDTEDLTRANV